MKILIVNGVMNCGGAEVMLMDILRHKPSDVQMDFLINERLVDKGKRGYFDDEIEALGCKIYHIGSQGALGPLRYMQEMKRIIAEISPDVVHTHLNAKNGFIAYAAYCSGVKKIISHCHADIHFSGSFLNRFRNEMEVFFQKFLISHYCSGFWGCSIEANKRLYWPWIRKKSVVVKNAIDVDKYCHIEALEVKMLRDSYNLPNGSVVLGNVGRIVRHKGIAFVPDIMFELKQLGLDSIFVVAGRPDDQSYVNEMMVKAQQYNLSDRIVMLGERGDIPLVMNTFDVFVGTALNEGFGMVAVEAQAAGIPCILYKGFPQLVDMHLGLVRYEDSFDAKTWAKDIKELLNKKIVDKDLVASTIRMLGFDSIENARIVCELYKQ